MTTIRASCTTCGDVELTVADVEVRVCTTTDEGVYHFDCPRCATEVAKPAEPRIIDLLVASGVHVTSWSIPAELLEEHHGEPITHDDLLDFHELLADERVVEIALASLTDPEGSR
ncbi:MAG: hypothetical protein OEU32_10035 [Acidimicrobiia bacterium]|nr:hypothetical protein [Acidimicrobiia bacterium]